MRHRTLQAAAIVFLCAGVVSAQSTIFVVRHADREATEPDALLTKEGERQAASLARLLASANIAHIFTSEATRTKQTATPTAQHFRVEVVPIESRDLEALIRNVRAGLRPGEGTLVVGHRDTVPRIVKALTGKDVPPLEASEYDRLEVVTLLPGGQSNVVTLRFGH